MTAVLIIGACGGAGSTLVTGGLALARAAAGHPPQLVELDLDRGDIAGAWGVPCDRTLADLLAVAQELGVEHVRHARHTHASGVGLLLSPGRPGASRGWDAAAVDALMAAIGGEGDVFIDGGSGLSEPARAAALHADSILVATPPTLAGARRALRVCEALSDEGAPSPRLVVNRGAGASELGDTAVGVAIGVPVAAIIPYSVREAGEIAAGRRPRARRGGLVDVLDELAGAIIPEGR